MTKTVLIEDWASGPNGFGYPQNQRKLVRMAKTNQISPPAMKDGGKWVVYENAKFIGIQSNHTVSKNLPDAVRKMVERTLNGKATQAQR